MSETSHTELAQRIGLSLLLGAYGDWLGSALEGVPIADRHLDASAGLLTDDTIFTMATARSLVAAGGVDPASISACMLEAFEAGVPGIGSSTLGAMQALSVGQHWALSGISGDRAAGNGAAMRIAPVAFAVDPWTAKGRQLTIDVARITHRNDEAIAGALAFASGIRLALHGIQSRRSALLEIVNLLPDTLVRDAVAQAAQLEGAEAVDAARQLGSSGYVVESVPLALYVGLSDVDSASSTLESVVLVAEDADTVGSMVGQLLGAVGHPAVSGFDIDAHYRDVPEISEGIAALSKTWNARG